MSDIFIFYWVRDLHLKMERRANLVARVCDTPKHFPTKIDLGRENK
jgi:hypothetical protein